MHSFRRVVRRHEREAILKHPAAWDHLYRAQVEASRAFKNGPRARRAAYSPISVNFSRTMHRRRASDPFEDFTLDASASGFNPVPQNRHSLERSRSPYSERSRQSSHDSNSVLSEEALSYEEPSEEVDLTALPLHVGRGWDSPVPLPSVR